jgi:Raf kinase inhibitor-like YbhB/YbcL family protein
MKAGAPICTRAILIGIIPVCLALATLSSGGPAMAITITSSAFTEGALIPKKHTCDAEDTSPDLKWSGVPKEAKSLALICDDPDAPVGTWVHWVLFDIPADVNALPAGLPADATLKNGSRHGKNDFRKLGYGGPCPPGGTHRYFFKVYALDTVLSLDSGSTKAQVVAAMKGHILAEGQLMGKYKR